MITLFNAFQIVAGFVAWPFFISWLSQASFRGAGVAFYAACGCYVIAFGAMVAAITDQIERTNKPVR